MKTSITKHGDTISVTLTGRLDTAAAVQVQQELQPLFEMGGGEVVIDCTALEYISSSGLRILLSLSKRLPSLRVTEVNPEVYGVLETTGFTKIMNVEKALRRLSVEGCTIIGQGGVGTVYRAGDDTIIKVFREGTTIEEVRTEITMAKEAFVLGMPTAISFDVVRVGSQYGLVYELLQADTLSACLAREPERVDDFAKLYAALFRQLHAIQVPQNGVIPSAAEREERAIRHISRYFDTEETDLLMSIATAIPQGGRLLHCDLQAKNAMLQQGELMLIDMGEISYGHPLIDLAHGHSAMVKLVGDYEAIIGIPRQLGIDLWQRMLGYYFEGEKRDVVAHRLEQIDVASVVRNFAWLSLSDSFPDAVVRECRDVFEERVTRRKDYLLGVSRTFTDWTLS